MPKVQQSKEPLDLWIEALESGRYWQAHGRLRPPSDDPQIMGRMYSVIGVLCDLFIKHAPEEVRKCARWSDDHFVYKDERTEMREGSVFPPQVMLWLGIEKFDLMALVLQLEHSGRCTFEDYAAILRYARVRNFTVAKRVA